MPLQIVYQKWKAVAQVCSYFEISPKLSFPLSPHDWLRRCFQTFQCLIDPPFTGSLTEDTASMPVVDRRKDEEGSDAENDEDDKGEQCHFSIEL